jgi:hypothetical protein
MGLFLTEQVLHPVLVPWVSYDCSESGRTVCGYGYGIADDGKVVDAYRGPPRDRYD